MNTKENTSEEIDLGQLFKLIGNAINTFCNRISNSLKAIYHLFILCILFLRVHFFKFCLAAILGMGLGGYLDYNALRVYKSSMIVQPNFNSVRQLYDNIEFYNQLVREEEIEELEKVLHIPQSTAKNITSIKITPLIDRVQKIKQFNEFIKDLDSVTRKNINYEDYLKNFDGINAEYHKIQIEATAPEIAKQCQKMIVTSIKNNEYFKLQKKVNDDNLAVRDTIVNKQLEEIDKLQSLYKEIRVIEAQQPEGTTNINLADNNKLEKIPELELFKEIEKLKEEKTEVNIEKANTKNTINIVSDFPNRGVLINDLRYKKIIQIPALFMGILLSILVILIFNKYLANYKK
ncbi:hypothetical protein LV716_01305 [Flagellimonas sp. HMM57]|uniref:hypothetical protein n=1 Tax=unclassified Flagellimonas TaxID=2644544 RepID=UPI0013D00C2F|nr:MULTISPECIES: hypothetical protein [unclassified Flagellimonas]UII76451.1 hypothetical protein LV716_01305 [Flagellimonas sp. HMM57]